MAPVKLPCVAGGDCTFETVELDYEYALAPTRAFSWLKAPTNAFTFKTLC